MSDADLEELAVEARLLKKFKAGKVVHMFNNFVVTQYFLQITKEEMERMLDQD